MAAFAFFDDLKLKKERATFLHSSTVADFHVTRSRVQQSLNRDSSVILKPAGAIEKDVLDWIPQGARRRGRPRKTWRRTIEEEITEMGKTCREVNALTNQRKRWRSFTGPYVPFGTKGTKSSQVKSNL
jgi:hypothetical protein